MATYLLLTTYFDSSRNEQNTRHINPLCCPASTCFLSSREKLAFSTYSFRPFFPSKLIPMSLSLITKSTLADMSNIWKSQSKESTETSFRQSSVLEMLLQWPEGVVNIFISKFPAFCSSSS